ncbi:MAG TPA: hypothetical protein VFJ90_15455 [Candidatus Didemnitutus sp.]|nr:hypothetical protein [Candidatus Didemnitutus sp.]
MKNNKATTSTPADLLRDLKALVAEGETLLAESVTEHSTEAVESLRARFDAAKEQFAEVYAGARKRVIAGTKYTDAAIRENPYQALAIATGISLLVGMLIGRRSK